MQPFLRNRIRKTYIYLYLLDSPEVLEYAASHRIDRLNWLERALLVERMKSKGKGKEAENIAKGMELALKNVKQSGEEFKRFFETILNAKKSE